MKSYEIVQPDACAIGFTSAYRVAQLYHRAGLPCRVCGTNIVLEQLGGRTLYWCPRDQA